MTNMKTYINETLKPKALSQNPAIEKIVSELITRDVPAHAISGVIAKTTRLTIERLGVDLNALEAAEILSDCGVICSDLNEFGPDELNSVKEGFRLSIENCKDVPADIYDMRINGLLEFVNTYARDIEKVYVRVMEVRQLFNRLSNDNEFDKLVAFVATQDGLVRLILEDLDISDAFRVECTKYIKKIDIHYRLHRRGFNSKIRNLFPDIQSDIQASCKRLGLIVD